MASSVAQEARDAAADASTDGLPRVRVLADVAAHGGERVAVEALYDVDRIGGGTGGHSTWLVLVDGTRISRAYAQVHDELGLVERRVLAVGKLTPGPADDAHALMAPHLAVERIDLAAGEAPGPKVVPAPPLTSAAPTLAPRYDRWTSVVGAVDRLDHRGEGVDAVLKLPDGTLVRVCRVEESSYRPWVGQTVTVTGLLRMEKGVAGPFAIELSLRGRTALCPGVRPGCGVSP